MKAHEPGVPPLAFVQLLNSDALEPDAVAHFRRIIDHQGTSELDLVRHEGIGRQNAALLCQRRNHAVGQDAFVFNGEGKRHGCGPSRPSSV